MFPWPGLGQRFKHRWQLAHRFLDRTTSVARRSVGWGRRSMSFAFSNRSSIGRQRAHVLSDDFAITLHKRLFGDVWDWAGKFRKTGKNIGIDPIDIPVELRTLMGDARYWADHNTCPPSEAAVRLHHRLVKIHPFANGNGRHARIMADTVLSRVYGAEPIDWAGGMTFKK
jgi:Fic-DOC domain mobile mystery protein B